MAAIYALLTMLLEFIVVHSAGMMGAVMLDGSSKSFRTVKVIGLALFYSVLVATFAFVAERWWPLLASWALTLNRSPACCCTRRPGVGSVSD